MHQSPIKSFVTVICLLGLCLITALLTAKTIDLTTADLGRHLANGRWVLADSDVLFTNFYSDTHPYAPFVNHHWLSGLIFYAVEQLSGFVGLSIFYVMLIVGAFALVVLTTLQGRSRWTCLAVALLVVPMVSYRTEVRPESLSFLLTGVVFVIVSGYMADRLSKKWLWTLPAIVAFWVNCHIYFFFGLVIIGAYMVEALIKSRALSSSQRKTMYAHKYRLLLLTLTAAGLASLANPEGWKLAIYPFRIFENYGYMIVENQGVPFFIKRGIHFPVFGPVYICLVTLWILSGLTIAKKRIESPIAAMFLALFLSLLALSAIRNISLFGLIALPVLIELMCTSLSLKWRKLASASAALLSAILFFITAGPQLLANTGLGLRPGSQDSANFYRSLNIRGPMFNNYDIGGYLIFNLFPETRVFVDNRPEAYPARFLTDVYIPAQESNEKWRELDDALHFNVIFFNWHDYTPAGQTFLINRIKDPDWAPVFVDPYALIMLRRNATNHEIISRFEIPKDRFSIKSSH